MWRHYQRRLCFGIICIQIAGFLKSGVVMNSIAVVLGILIVCEMRISVSEFGIPFPVCACFDSCTWPHIAGEVVILSDMTCRQTSDSSFAPITGFFEDFPVPGSPRTKIRAESSSNGSEVAGFRVDPAQKSTPNSFERGS